MYSLSIPTVFSKAIRACLLVLALIVQIPASQAALSINGTRLVFTSEQRSAALIVSNPSQQTYAVQTWVNTESDDTTTAVPLIASPPLFRLDPGKEQQVQINRLPNDLPEDRESLFFFNVQEIPQAENAESNVLNIALRTRIKVFHRPAGLTQNPTLRLKDLQWSIRQVEGKTHLWVDNPSPFHVSFLRIEVKGNGQQQAFSSPAMAYPFSSQSYPLEGIKPAAGLQVSFSTVDDYGAHVSSAPMAIQLLP
ncbi:chaperone protein EcpD [Pseudomonas sp. NFACC15-1]|uniref:fimbrial biogenesis chaperone n=1 Tax=unclassified Pseudomonas TaxID=196821 RepID=UPI00088B899F|nr:MULTISPECIES: molecular chaperone [unclassified Pseudomonas]SDA87188.1 chaperone protein EcpD [Pseudomonas sp. NFACC15-1]SDY78472.1 chaperone protein EcpD [Pseudomonas sp. NFACC14]